MNQSRLIKIVNDFFKAIYCLESFPYPLNQKIVDIHIIDKIQIKQNKVNKLNEDIQKIYSMNEFIPIIPKKGSKVYECQYKKIYQNIKKLSELIYLLKSMQFNLNKNLIEKILDKKVDGDIDLDDGDIKKFNDKMNLFDYLIIRNQREEYIKELKNRVEQINMIYKEIEVKQKEIDELKKKPSYELLYNIGQVEKITRTYFIKKITIFIMNFRNDFKQMKLTKEIAKLKNNNFDWSKLSNKEIEKVIDFICIYTKDQLIKIYQNNLNELIKKLYEIKKQTENINI